MTKQLDPQKVICIIRKNGVQVGSIPACSKNAVSYIDSFGECSVDYIEDEDYCYAYQMLNPGKWKYDV